ncbi:hypothetical protein [Methanosarcina barkeri]|uniref:Uncharacterized protein n=1 Tax=Methanosarcina barkeri CM1 TaxID=796385 RepID=A0A0G3CCS0_METBA|nr:hypothetical protein [Methanosarcina barkeri]AKJ39766.1 hypothetical protein MCM1_2767 [Methanosarcina barkeri CM1]
MNKINHEAKAIYAQHKEIYDHWVKGSDPFRKAIAKTIINASATDNTNENEVGAVL